jgi:hypothetical protein
MCRNCRSRRMAGGSPWNAVDGAFIVNVGDVLEVQTYS